MATETGQPVDDAEARVSRLLCDLAEAVALLERHGETHWAKRLDSARAEVEREDAHGLHRLVQSFGGMGSLNDVVLTQPGTAQVPGANERGADDRLDHLRSTIFANAIALLHNIH